MAKKKKSTQAELFEALRARGLRKSVARRVSSATGRAGNKGKTPKVVRDALSDLRGAVGEIEGRLTGRAKRTEAANKAARTRKRNAAKRSAAAKKGARTRAKARS
jgi:hypothetical protein